MKNVLFPHSVGLQPNITVGLESSFFKSLTSHSKEGNLTWRFFWKLVRAFLLRPFGTLGLFFISSHVPLLVVVLELLEGDHLGLGRLLVDLHALFNLNFLIFALRFLFGRAGAAIFRVAAIFGAVASVFSLFLFTEAVLLPLDGRVLLGIGSVEFGYGGELADLLGVGQAVEVGLGGRLGVAVGLLGPLIAALEAGVSRAAVGHVDGDDVLALGDAVERLDVEHVGGDGGRGRRRRVCWARRGGRGAAREARVAAGGGQRAADGRDAVARARFVYRLWTSDTMSAISFLDKKP